MRAAPTREALAAAVRVGDAAAELGRRIGGRRAFALIDAGAPAGLARAVAGAAIELPGGEGCKTLAAAGAVLARMAELELGRDAVVVGIGGGAICDLAGFAAATYARGVALGLVPTTLLAQVDAAIGGKNALDLGAWKNAVGTFHFPEFVICDPDALAALPAAELRAGLAEIVKAAAIADPALFAALEAAGPRLLDPAAPQLRRAAAAAIAVKVDIVARDPFEAGERRLLNFGHSVGHAVELTGGLGHGAAVAIGMVAAARISAALGLLPAGEAARLGALLARLGLPTAPPREAAGAAAALRRDKKREGDAVRLVVLRAIGRAAVARVPLAALGEVLP